MDKLNTKRIIVLCLPIVFAVSLAITLAACMAQAGREVNDGVFGTSDGDGTIGELPTISDGQNEASSGLEFTSRGDGTCVLTGVGDCADKNITVPEQSPDGETVQAIARSAFAGDTGIRRVTLPSTITTIGDYAFYESSLTEINIPSSVTSVGEAAFSNCRSLKKINVSGTNKSYCSVDGVLFSKDKSTLVCYPSGREGETYTIRMGVGYIKNAAFLGCVYLKSVSYNGSYKDWQTVKIGANNDSLSGMTINFLTQTTK